jgi:hypothetical protein
LSSEKYVRAAVSNVDKKLVGLGLRLQPKCLMPMTSGYRPELDSTAELNDEDCRYYQELIGVLGWAVELGCIDILTEVAMLSTYFALSRTGHLEQVYHIFGYLKENPKKTLAFDPRHPIRLTKDNSTRQQIGTSSTDMRRRLGCRRNRLQKEKPCQRIALLMPIMLGKS